MPTTLKEKVSSLMPELEEKNYLLFFRNVIKGVIVALHVEWWSLLQQKRVCILAPRNSGKTFFFVEGFVIWNIFFRRHMLIYIISDSQDQAVEILEKIKNHIENNEELHWLKGNTPETWTKQEIKCSNGVRVKTKGFGSAIRGPHPGLIILDDVLNDRDPLTQNGRAKAERYFRAAISNMLAKNESSQLVVIGTAQHYKDLLHTLKENTEYIWRKYKAIINENTKQVLIPERWSWDELQAKKREVGSLVFAKEFQNDPVDEESTIFPMQLMKLAWDSDYKAPMIYNGDGLFQTYLGADFSVPGHGGGDWTAVVTIGITGTGNVYLFDIFRGRGLSFSEQCSVICDRAQRFNVTRGFLEDNSFQAVYREATQGLTNLPIYGHTVSQSGKNSLLNGVPSLVVLFENLKMVLPYHKDDPRGRTMTEGLCDELHSFRMQDGKLGTVSDHDDLVMAFWHALCASRDRMKGTAASKRSIPILRKGSIHRQEMSDLARRGYKR